MIITLNEACIAVIVKSLNTALQHEQEAVATGEVDVEEVGKIREALSRLEASVASSLKDQFAARMADMGFDWVE